MANGDDGLKGTFSSLIGNEEKEEKELEQIVQDSKEEIKEMKQEIQMEEHVIEEAKEAEEKLEDLEEKERDIANLVSDLQQKKQEQNSRSLLDEFRGNNDGQVQKEIDRIKGDLEKAFNDAEALEEEIANIEENIKEEINHEKIAENDMQETARLIQQVDQQQNQANQALKSIENHLGGTQAR